MGPGTNVLGRIYSNQLPVDDDDFVSLIHDLEYLSASSSIDVINADMQAISDYNYDAHGVIGKLGLFSKLLVTPIFANSYFADNRKRESITALIYLKDKELNPKRYNLIIQALARVRA